jgi:hypothetical protein
MIDKLFERNRQLLHDDLKRDEFQRRMDPREKPRLRTQRKPVVEFESDNVGLKRMTSYNEWLYDTTRCRTPH